MSFNDALFKIESSMFFKFGKFFLMFASSTSVQGPDLAIFGILKIFFGVMPSGDESSSSSPPVELSLSGSEEELSSSSLLLITRFRILDFF